MVVRQRSSRTRSLLVVLVLLAVTLITIDARGGGGDLQRARNGLRDVFTPVQTATHDTLRPVGDFLTGAVHYGSLRQENEQLRRQLAAVSQSEIQAAAEARQAQQVAETEHLTFVGSIRTVAAQVIDEPDANFENSVTIDKGSADGLVAGQPVVTGGAVVGSGGLVGTIGEVAAHTSTITLLTDPDFVAGVRLDPVNIGSAQGVGRGSPLRVTVISTSQAPPTLKKGEAVVTSGLDLDKFPANIPVGRIASVTTSAASPEPVVTIAPLVNLSQLDVVQVELWSPQTAPAAP